MPDEAGSSQKGKSEVLASVQPSVGALSLMGSNFKQEVSLCAYRATPHCTTKIAPADLVYPS